MRLQQISRRQFLGAGVSLVAGCAAPTVTASGAPAVEFRNGHWFDGATFELERFYSIAGRLTRHRPSGPVTSVDLGGGYVTPPFGEAHNHNIDGPWGVTDVLARYWRAGVFYVLNPTSVGDFVGQIPGRWINAPTATEIAFVRNTFTGPGGHPMGLYEDQLRESYYGEVAGPLPRGWFAGRAYDVVEDSAAVERALDRTAPVAGEFIKVVLSYSEDYRENLLSNSPYVRRGIDPALVGPIVALARGRGLRVIAHVETQQDFHYALAGGIIEFAHLPGYYVHSPQEAHRAVIAEADAERAGSVGAIVATTTILTRRLVHNDEMVARIQDIQRRNLDLLGTNGVRFVVGSDDVSDTSAGEIANLRSLGVFSDAELLRLWCEETPRYIFPGRSLGRLDEAMEASFLVFANNPAADLEGRTITHRFKGGMPASRPTG